MKADELGTHRKWFMVGQGQVRESDSKANGNVWFEADFNGSIPNSLLMEHF